MISWSDKFSVGVKTIDEQHRKLVEMLNELHGAMKIGKGKEALSNILESMFDYAKEHFATEERYMEKYSFPGTVKHKSEHKEFVDAATDFYTRYLGGSATSIEVYNFLQKWLVNHILNTDKKLGKFLCEVR
ncbi:bacteriohemerythrin [Archaeoglobus neptunius]|uniref:bacteriohemerythrin n=1 Tax=Archaeoglobus neptunius TaxID=2798580 RepID=UPI0019257817|nr:bacteriohemerythrin [Archaeoglobus neptunius]